jgi:hypothetical protein
MGKKDFFFFQFKKFQTGGEMCPPPPAACAALKKMEERCVVLNPYCDLNKAIANRASHHHPIWKRWAKKTKNQDTMKKKKQVPIHNSWILLLLLTQEKRRWYMTYSIYISLFMCLSPVFGNKQTLPHLYIYKYVCIILYIIIVEYPHHPPLQKHFCRSVNESSYFSFFFLNFQEKW